MKHVLVALLLLFAGVAHAAKVPVSLTTPSTNTDNSALTNLAKIIVEWGTCSGDAFGVSKGTSVILTTQIGVRLRTFIYPSGYQRICVRAFAVNSADVSSAPSNVAVASLLPATGKPVTLQKPVILP